MTEHTDALQYDYVVFDEDDDGGEGWSEEDVEENPVLESDRDRLYRYGREGGGGGGGGGQTMFGIFEKTHFLWMRERERKAGKGKGKGRSADVGVDDDGVGL